MSARMSPAEFAQLARQESTTDLRVAARVTGWSRNTLTAAFHEGTLPFPACQVGRSIKVPTRPLAAWLGIDLDDETAAEVLPASVRPIRPGHGAASGEGNRWKAGRDAAG